MTLIRWEPFRNISALQNRINRLFEDAFPDENDAIADRADWNPTIDIYDTVEAIVVEAELPGIPKENVSIEIKENILNIRGRRTADKEIKEESYYRRERAYGSFRRSFHLPSSVEADKITASFKDGILKINIPKPDEKAPKRISIDVE
jgi:HSP20 family protein